MAVLYDRVGVYDCAIAVIISKGYQVWYDRELEDFWAEKDGRDFVSPTPTGLLGVISMWEELGLQEWKYQWWKTPEAALVNHLELPSAPERPYVSRSGGDDR